MSDEREQIQPRNQGRSASRDRLQRLLTARDAAAYLGYRGTDILDKIPVNPIYLQALSPPRWDVRDLDRLIDSLSQSVGNGGGELPEDADDALKQWKAGRAAK